MGALPKNRGKPHMTNEKPEAGEHPQGTPEEPAGENEATESNRLFTKESG